MQPINKNLNDIYFYFNNFDLVCDSASEVSRYFVSITAPRRIILIAVFQSSGIKSEERSGSVSQRQGEEVRRKRDKPYPWQPKATRE
ncbi:TPA: hypothetical protein M4K80_000109 [Salmonella enterica]|nr:hypothetical protein [Salmonella enterica]